MRRRVDYLKVACQIQLLVVGVLRLVEFRVRSDRALQATIVVPVGFGHAELAFRIFLVQLLYL